MNFHGKILYCTHKFCELEFLKLKNPNNLFKFNVRWSFRGDHCGFLFDVEVYKMYVNFTIYDHRHWNWKDNRYMTEKDRVDFEDVC